MKEVYKFLPHAVPLEIVIIFQFVVIFVFNPNPGTLRKLHKGVARTFYAPALILRNYCKFRHSGLLRDLIISFLVQASNLITRRLYFVKYGKGWGPKIFVTQRVQVTSQCNSW